MTPKDEDPINTCGHRVSEREKAFEEFPTSMCPACLLDRTKAKDKEINFLKDGNTKLIGTVVDQERLLDEREKEIERLKEMYRQLEVKSDATGVELERIQRLMKALKGE